MTVETLNPPAGLSPALAAKVSRTHALLAEAVAAGPAVLANSLSAEDMVLTAMIAAARLPVAIITLDTGMLPPESLALIGAAEARFGIAIEVYRPDAAAISAYVGERGSAYAFYDSLEARKACCMMRKVAPLDAALAGAGSWITGMRREQAASRDGLAEAEFDADRAMAKFNPLAAWSWDDVQEFAAAHDVPMNSLYQRGYVSIGCGPCTRALKPGEHPRAARWWWEDETAAKECGLHVAAGSQTS
jgi:phosphoadenosine phosphosulfate reductase